MASLRIENGRKRLDFAAGRYVSGRGLSRPRRMLACSRPDDADDARDAQARSGGAAARGVPPRTRRRARHRVAGGRAGARRSRAARAGRGHRDPDGAEGRRRRPGERDGPHARRYALFGDPDRRRSPAPGPGLQPLPPLLEPRHAPDHAGRVLARHRPERHQPGARPVRRSARQRCVRRLGLLGPHPDAGRRADRGGPRRRLERVGQLRSRRRRAGPLTPAHRARALLRRELRQRKRR